MGSKPSSLPSDASRGLSEPTKQNVWCNNNVLCTGPSIILCGLLETCTSSPQYQCWNHVHCSEVSSSSLPWGSIFFSVVLKRATTIKRRGMDVRQGQPCEEQYGDISSLGERESGPAQYEHVKCYPAAGHNVTWLFLSVSPTPPTTSNRPAHGQRKHSECKTRPNGLFSPQGASLAYFYSPRGEDAHVLLDGARPRGSQHAVRCHRSPQPASVALQLPL